MPSTRTPWRSCCGWADGLWNILYYEALLGRFDEHTHAITGAHFRKETC